MISNNFKNKKVTVMGLGLHGGGVAIAKWLVKHGAKVIVTDLKTPRGLASSLEKFTPAEKKKIIFVLGRHRIMDFQTGAMIVQNPGVPRESRYIKIARQAGIPIVSEASIFFSLCPASIIGVTGTRGKSTTSTLIYRLLNSKFESRNSKVSRIWLAGLAQRPMAEIIDRIKPRDVVAAELSSWQLEILGEHKLSPFISVFTNIYPDHLNRYSGLSSYVEAKTNILRNQGAADFAILNFEDPLVRELGSQVQGQRFWFAKKSVADQNGCFVKNGAVIFRSQGVEKSLVRLSDIKLRGGHNLENVLAALTVAGIYQVPRAKIKKVLSGFSGLPGRTELVRKIQGIDFINDTTATMPDATLAAIKSQIPKFKTQNSKLVLIAGGADKNIPQERFDELAKRIRKYCRAVILFQGDGSEKIKKSLKKFSASTSVFQELESMVDAVAIARSVAKKGDTVLLSPAAASFGLFINEFDRGDQFNQAVKSIKG